MPQEIIQLVTNDGLKLHAKVDLVDQPKRNLIIVHGLGEHSGRYEYLTQKLNTQATNVFRFDLRGHGMSEGRHAYINDFRDYINDTSTIVDYVMSTSDHVKTFLFGHSMGGYIAAAYETFYPESFDGIILSAAATNTPKEAKGFMKKMLYLLSKTAPKMALANDLGTKISKDPAVVTAYLEDDLNRKKITANLFYQFLVKGIDNLNEQVTSFCSPLMMLHGEEDKIIPHDYSHRFLSLISSKDKILITYPGLHHEIFNEPEKDVVISDLIKWLDEHSEVY